MILAVLAMFPQIAGADLFDILNEKYIDNIHDLPFSPGNPAISWQEQDHIKAWIDIVGFRNLSKEGDIYYILGDPANLAIVQYDVKADPPGSLDSLDKSISVYQSGNNTTASLHVVLKYHTVSCDESGCYVSGRYTEEKDFTDSEAIPEQFLNIISPQVNITEYNNILEPKISIQITGINSNGISLHYGNKSITHSSKSYHVEKTEKGIYYANASNLDAWEIQGQGIARFGKLIIINTNLSSVDYSQLDIRVSSLYGSVKVNPSQFNISRVTYQPETVLYNPVIFGFLGVFFTLTGSAYYLIKQVIL